MTENFRDPGNEYRSIPFWSWNCGVTRELIDEDLDTFVKMGFGGVCPHPRTGLDVEYLGGEFMDLMEYAARGCERRGLTLWLYDDDRFPSGAAGGKVTKSGKFRGKYLLLSENCQEGFIAAWELAFDGEKLSRYRRLKTVEEVDTAMARRDEARRVRFAYPALLPEEPWFEGSGYIDTTDPEAVREFIRVTHERYYKRLGRYFGTTVKAVFTDEPRACPRVKGLSVSDPLTHGDFAFPLTPAVNCKILGAGLDPLETLPAVVWDSSDPRAEGVRGVFREALCECFVTAFLDQVGFWCREHNIMSTGHILGEETLRSQTDTVGEAMRCCRDMDLPGTDTLIDEANYPAVRQAASVSRQMGKAGVMSELYGSTGWECDFLTYKLQGDWQAAMGVTHRVPHLCHMSLGGEAKRDWPGSIFTQNTWWERFKLLEDHFARLNVILRRGRRVTRVSVIHPVEAYWRRAMCGSEAEREKAELSRRFDALIRRSLTSLIDVELVSEALLAEGKMTLSGFDAAVVTAPVRESTEIALSEFSGEVIRSENVDEIMARLEKYRDVSITSLASPAEFLYQLREDGNKKWLFLCHTKNSAGGEEQNDINLRGAFRARVFDTATGEVSPVETRFYGGRTHILWRTRVDESLLLELTPGTPLSSEPFSVSATAGSEAPALLSPLSVIRDEPNALLLDRARYSLDGSPLSERMEILRLDNRLRGRLGLAPRCENMRQPWATEPGEKHGLTLLYEFETEVPLSGLTLAVERPEEQSIMLDGAKCAGPDGYFIDRAFRTVSLPPIGAGRHELVIRRSFDAKTNLESMYLLGDFAVKGGRLTGAGPLRDGDIRPQGYPYYTGKLIYSYGFDLAGAGEYELELSSLSAPFAEAVLDGGAPVPLISRRARLGRLPAGRHGLTLTVYLSRFNLLGALHNADADDPWRGPDSWRTRGDKWSDEHLTRPAGLTGPVRLIGTKG